MMTSYENAAFNTVHDYPGGAKRLGEEIDINGQVLAHKVNPNDQANQLTVQQARKIMVKTSDYRMLYALANELNHVCIRSVDAHSDQCLHKSITKTVKEFGEFLAAVSDATEDGDVTVNELRNIDKELGELIGKANFLRSLCAQWAANNEAGK